MLQAPGTPDGDVPDRSRLTGEECAVLDALDAADAYEDAGDDFFADLVGGAEDAARKAAFGEYLDDDEEEELEDDGARPRGEDGAFDALLDEYSEDKLGALEDEEETDMCGSQQIETFEHILDAHLEKPVQQQARIRAGLDAHLGERVELPDVDEPLEPLETVEVQTGPEWDCESVLSLRSNLSNHPGKVERPDQKKVRAPRGAKPLPEIDEVEAVELPEVSTYRPRGETAEEKHDRKKAVKEHQRTCRALKKETKEAFKAEAKKAHAKPNAGDLCDGIRHRPM